MEERADLAERQAQQKDLSGAVRKAWLFSIGPDVLHHEMTMGPTNLAG